MAKFNYNWSILHVGMSRIAADISVTNSLDLHPRTPNFTSIGEVFGIRHSGLLLFCQNSQMTRAAKTGKNGWVKEQFSHH
jgi:hypothetical protein